MTINLLIDLDDTLLGNKMETFMPAYLGAFGNHVAQYVDPELMITTLITTTQKIFNHSELDRTLNQIYMEAYLPIMDTREEVAQSVIGDFYVNIFPKLRNITEYRPEAVELVETAFARGYRVGIATNPVFPLTAIVERLDWARLSTEKYPFSLISSNETFHFAKPNPAFFAEFLGQMGWPEGPIVMVGNDLDHDIRAAHLMGIPTFWITDGESSPPEPPFIPDASGTLSEVLPWLDSIPEEDIKPNFSSPSALIAILEATPATIATLSTGLSADDWTLRPQESEWCVTEIVAHLRDVEKEVNLPRLKRILTESNPFIAGKDTDPWAGEREYIKQNGPDALYDFIETRKETMSLLKSIDDRGWQRQARHTIFGLTQLIELVSIISGHDRLHIKQLYHVLASIRDP